MNEVENKEIQTLDNEKTNKAAAFFKKASDMGKKVADNVQKNASALSEKAKSENYQRRLEKYNPLFLKEYKSKRFVFPNLIKIVEDSVIQGIDVCEGAIGWRERINEVEVLILSTTFASKCGLLFFPGISSNTLFCVDTFDKSRFVNVDRIFSKTHEEKLAELKHIAYALGAKNCSIELVESDELSEIKARDAQTKMPSNQEL